MKEADLVLVSDFVNTTGEPIFDDTLKQALTVKLAESPYLNVVLRRHLKFQESVTPVPTRARRSSRLPNGCCKKHSLSNFVTREERRCWLHSCGAGARSRHSPGCVARIRPNATLTIKPAPTPMPTSLRPCGSLCRAHRNPAHRAPCECRFHGRVASTLHPLYSEAHFAASHPR